jgi:hypothetical protein
VSGLICGRCALPYRAVHGVAACACGTVDRGEASARVHRPHDDVPAAEIVPGTPPVRRRDSASVRPPAGWSGKEPPLRIPEWQPLGLAEMRMEDVAKNVYITGETGSGKSQSGVLPLARALLRYPGGGSRDLSLQLSDLAPAMFVVDPKQELAAELYAENRRCGLGRDIQVLQPGAGSWRVWPFNRDEPLDLSGGQITQRIVEPSRDFELQSHGREPFFSLNGVRALDVLFECDVALYRLGGVERLRRFWQVLAHQLQVGERVYLPTDEYLGRALELLSAVARSSPATGILTTYTRLAAAYGVSNALQAQVLSLGDMAYETITSVIATLRGMTRDIASPQYSAHVWMDPFTPPPGGDHLDVPTCLEDGTVVVYSPAGTSPAEIALGRALKSTFYREAYRRSGANPRALGVVVDEAQHFVHSGPAGEHSLLDRGRAFRVIAILATQSVASLKHALSTDPVPGRAEAALEILLANTATKLFFRSTEPSAGEVLRQLLPPPPIPDLQHIALVRGATSLLPGECYLLTPGYWTRGRVALR